jgi:hypothetical protein
LVKALWPKGYRRRICFQRRSLPRTNSPARLV